MRNQKKIRVNFHSVNQYSQYPIFLIGEEYINLSLIIALSKK